MQTNRHIRKDKEHAVIEQARDNVDYYYDSHPTEEDLMGEAFDHATVVRYLMAVLLWLFHGQLCAINENMNFYQTANKDEYPIAPDIAVIKGVPARRIKSWRIGKTGPAPQVVFEIASEETWSKDLNEKVWKYARMGVQEYFAYDPNDPPVWRGIARRLIGWQLDQDTQVMHKMLASPDGRLWSPHLSSFLVPDSAYLRLYDRSGRLRLTEAEAEAEARRAAMHLAEAEAEARRDAMHLAEEQGEKARTFAEKLRSLGVDPEQLL